MRLWQERVHEINWELFDRGTRGLHLVCAGRDWPRLRQDAELLDGAPHGDRTRGICRRGGQGCNSASRIDAVAFDSRSRHCAKNWKSPFRASVFFWPRQTGPKGTWSTTKWAACCKCPAGAISSPSRSSTASKCSRPACGPTSASRCSAPIWTRSIGLQRDRSRPQADQRCRDVIAAPIMGKGYLQIDIDRENAALATASRSRTFRTRSKWPWPAGQ